MFDIGYYILSYSSILFIRIKFTPLLSRYLSLEIRVLSSRFVYRCRLRGQIKRYRNSINRDLLSNRI